MPLMSERKLLGVDLEILARVPTIGRFDRSVAALSRAMKASRRVPTVRYFRRLCPSVAGHEIVRVLGRLPSSETQQSFLITSLRDEELDAQTRLAAASALTRHTSEAAVRAIEAHRQMLNGLTEGRLGDRFLETMRLRTKYERNMQPLREPEIWRQLEPPNSDRLIAAFTCRHPLALDDLLRRLGATTVERDPDIRRTFADSLIAISRNASQHSQPWSTYFDTAFRVARRISWERRAGSRRTLSEHECHQIEQNIKAVLP
jgi:hypothetical protein